MSTICVTISRVVERYLADKDLNLSQLARRMGYKPRTLNSKMRLDRNWSLADVENLVKVGVLEDETLLDLCYGGELDDE